MIVKITAHKTSTSVVVVHVGPDLAAFMGAFPGARWQDKPKAYWLPADQLDTFTRHVARCGHTLVDERGAGDEAEKFTGPLPECSACGQPASRQASMSLNRCPACGAEWRPVVVDTPAATGSWTPRIECAVCGRRQRAGWAYCGGCGTPATQLGAPGPRPEHVERPKLAEPALFGDLAEEALADLEERRDELGDDERDFAQRAAGDR